MKKAFLILTATALLFPLTSCKKKEAVEEKTTTAPAVTFTVYPGSRYLPELTELFKKGGAISQPGRPVTPQVLYDTEAPLETVAEFYAKNNGLQKVWPDSTGDFNTVSPPAYYRTGDQATDLKAIQPLLEKLNVKVDASKAVGDYKGAQIGGNGHPRVTLTRPYFDLLQQKVIDRTLVIMAQE